MAKALLTESLDVVLVDGVHTVEPMPAEGGGLVLMVNPRVAFRDIAGPDSAVLGYLSKNMDK